MRSFKKGGLLRDLPEMVTFFLAEGSWYQGLLFFFLFLLFI
jgi:hypothetical protein